MILVINLTRRRQRFRLIDTLEWQYWVGWLESS